MRKWNTATASMTSTKLWKLCKKAIKCHFNDRRRKIHGWYIIVVSERLLVEWQKWRYCLNNFNKVAVHLPMHSNSGPWSSPARKVYLTRIPIWSCLLRAMCERHVSSQHMVKSLTLNPYEPIKFETLNPYLVNKY